MAPGPEYPQVHVTWPPGPGKGTQRSLRHSYDRYGLFPTNGGMDNKAADSGAELDGNQS